MEIWDEVVQEFNQEIERLKASLGDGAAEDFAHYRHVDKFPNGGWCNVGDYVCYGKHAGTKLYYQNVKLLLLFDDQVIMRVNDPKDLDPTFNLAKH